MLCDALCAAAMLRQGTTIISPSGMACNVPCTPVTNSQSHCYCHPPALHRYMPILPMVLVNGAEGIGTGWSTFIPNYSPREIAANLKRLLAGQPLEPMQPWYRGFT